MRCFRKWRSSEINSVLALAAASSRYLRLLGGDIGGLRLLILDEPLGGLAPMVVDRILEVATSLCDERVAIFLVGQLVEKA